MSTWVTKSAIGLLSFSGLLALGTAINYRSKVTIEEHLNSIELPILAKGASEWSTVIQKYKDSNNKLKISEIKEINENSLKDWCLSKSKEYTNNKELLIRISAWCTHPYTIKEWIEKKKKRIVIKDISNKQNCNINKDKHFIYTEDEMYLQFIEQCTTLINN